MRLFGGREGLLGELRGGLAELGFEFSLAVDAAARGALWRARAAGAALEALPLGVTGFDPEFFDSIGIATVGDLLRLPREGLAQRCGQRVLDALDQARGALPEPRDYFAPPPRFAARLELPAAVAQAEGLLFGARRLLAQLEGLLSARQAGIRGFRLVLLGESRPVTLEIGLASPARDAERLAQLLRERLGRMTLASPVAAICLEAGDFTPLHGQSRGLFGDRAAESEGWARLLERLRARLGHEAVSGLATRPDHRPEHAWRCVEPGEWDPREWLPPGPRPLWLLQAKKLEEGGFTALSGPERIEAGWWDGDDARRDYFVARLPDGALAWVYREADRSSADWFLHGLFA